MKDKFKNRLLFWLVNISPQGYKIIIGNIGTRAVIPPGDINHIFGRNVVGKLTFNTRLPRFNPGNVDYH